MQLHAIDTGFFKLDGGAMFGIVPKTIWNKINPADENNMCTWAMRCLLIEMGNRLILVDTGIGNKQDDKFFQYFYLHGGDTLEKSIRSKGYSPEEVTDVILTHLHFDHCGGAVKLENGKPTLSFPNAKYWSHSEHWAWALNPNPREKNSFLKDNILPIQESGHLNFINQENDFADLGISFITVSGHTEKQLVPKIQYKNKTLVYLADLMPSVGHLPIPYVLSYDVQPLLTLQEKEQMLQEALKNEYIFMFEHDPKVECCTVQQTARGIREQETFPLAAI